MQEPGTPFRTYVADATAPEAREDWGRLCLSSPQHTVFSELTFAESLGEVLGLPLRLALVLEAGRPCAGALLYLKRRWPYVAASHPPLVPVHSPLLAGPLSESGVHQGRSPLDVLLRTISREVHQATYALHPSLSDARAFAWHRWRVQPAYTYRLSLDASGPVPDAWSENPRRILRKEQGSFVVEEDPVGIREIIDLVETSLRRQGETQDVTIEAMVRMATEMATAGLARPFLARRGARADAGVVILSDGRTAYYWLAGSRPGPSMTVLLAGALERLQAEGVRHFDMVGANTPSVAEFKRRFGATLVPYFRVRASSRPELRLLDRLRWG